MTILFPPVLESRAPSFPFYSTNTDSHFLEIRFQMPTVVPRDEIKHLQVSIKSAATGASAVDSSVAPDRATLFIAADSVYFSREVNGNYLIRIPYWCFRGGFPAKNNTYLVQVRFGANRLWANAGSGLDKSGFANFAAWRQAATTQVPSLFGEWSNIQKAYCYGSATHSINFNFNDFVPEVEWFYSTDGDDPIEQVKILYQYHTLNGIETKTEVFNGQYNDDNEFSLRVKLNVAPVDNIVVSIEAVTKNNTIWGDTTTINSILGDYSSLSVYGDGKIKDVEMSAPEKEDGAISKSIEIPPGLDGKALFSVYRINTLSLSCIKIIDKQSILLGETFSFKDYTVEMGEDYQYVICAVIDDKVTYLLNDLRPFGTKNPGYARLMRMDSAYLTTRQHQLRLQGNLQITNFKRNTQDAFTTTIGGQFPFYSRASKMNYRSFSISAVVSINFDPTSTFLRLDAVGKIALGDVLTFDQYNRLIEMSPGLIPFFTQDGVDETNRPSWRFTGPPLGSRMSIEDCVNLVNRCASNLTLNGLWWDDGNTSQLYIQDRDIFFNDELSLSRRRMGVKKDQSMSRIDILKDENSIRPDVQEELNFEARGLEKELQGPKTVYDQYLYRQSGLNYGVLQTDEQIFIERKFREKVMQWLGDGKPKLFRSETEGNMIVMLSNVSFSPLDKTGRMVYSMNATATEIAEFNTENLLEYNLVPSEIRSVYIENSEYGFTPGQEDQNVLQRLTFYYSDRFEIPNLRLNDPTMDVNIPIYEGIVYGTGPFIFEAQGLPNGLSIVRQDSGSLKGGTIVGYPIGDANQEPGYVIITIEDQNKDKVTVQIPKGYMYLPFSNLTTIYLHSINPNKSTLLVGEEIAVEDAHGHFDGGLGPFRFTRENLPVGVDINSTTGIISGRYGQPENEGDGYIKVRDRMGQVAIIPVKYVEGVQPLTYVKIDSYNYEYTEVNVPLTPKDVSGTAYGGKKPYTFTANDTVYPIPQGWSITPDGVIQGTPERARERGSFIVTVTDDEGSKASIMINFDTILEEFVFDGNSNIWIFPYKGASDPDGNPIPSDIPLGANMDDIGGINVTPYVRGGLKFTTGAPYRFEATGLLPNWAIDQTGMITGRARVAMPRHEATLIAIDARGERRPYTILVGEVTGAIKFQHSGYNVINLYQNKEINAANVERKDNGATGTVIPSSYITQGSPPYKIIGVGFPEGIYLEELENATTNRSSWQFKGTPTKPTPARTGWLQISDQAGNMVQVQVDFEQVYPQLRWVLDSPITVVGDPMSKFSIRLLGLSGGKPRKGEGEAPFDFAFLGIAAEDMTDWVIASPTPEDITTYTLSGTLPNKPNWNQAFAIQVTDAFGESVRGNFSFKVLPSSLRVTFKKDYAGVIMMKNHAIVKKDSNLVMEISGGTPPYKITRLGGGEAFPGVNFIVENGNVYCEGTPVSLQGSSVDVSGQIIISDSSPTVKSIVPSFTWYIPKVIEYPIISGEVVNNPETALTGDITEGSIYYGYLYTGHKYFERLYFPGTYVSLTKGILPQGIGIIQNKEYATVSGTPLEKNPTTTDVTLTLTTPATEYDAAITKTVNVSWDSVAGQFAFSVLEDIPAVGVGKPIPKIDLGQGVVGGTGGYSWTVTPPLPNGLELKFDASNTKNAWIEGAPTVKEDARTFTITVVDNVTERKLSDTIRYGGAYDPIVVSGGTTILSPTASTDFGPQKITQTVSGGVPITTDNPYLFHDDDNLLSKFGLVIMETTGEIQGVTTDKEVKAKDGFIYVVDKMGQKEKIAVHINAMKGNLNYDTDEGSGPYAIPSGRKGTTVTAGLPNLYGAALGGTPPYTFEERTPDGWADAGFKVTMNNQGRFTSITYPTTTKPAGSFFVTLKDSGGQTMDISVPYGEVIN